MEGMDLSELIYSFSKVSFHICLQVPVRNEGET